MDITHRFRYLENVPLNDTHFDLEVNFVEYWEEKPNGKIQHFSWVTDLAVGPDQLMPIMRAGRARWRIENKTFNALKNAGYAFEHNFGHGKDHLATVLMHVMMLAFLVDQIQGHCCSLFQTAVEKRGGRLSYLWVIFRSLIQSVKMPDWQVVYDVLAKRATLTWHYDTS